MNMRIPYALPLELCYRRCRSTRRPSRRERGPGRCKKRRGYLAVTKRSRFADTSFAQFLKQIVTTFKLSNLALLWSKRRSSLYAQTGVADMNPFRRVEILKTFERISSRELCRQRQAVNCNPPRGHQIASRRHVGRPADLAATDGGIEYAALARQTEVETWSVSTPRHPGTRA
ncbi:hypothetical protein HPB48_008447 [Haemaphysalis longicornis]|uniref:Uncharacterized protein n=1 Tax=Haemaphysalis longicornis TaxID=44386 RepID=A0A9J6H0L1_HAELO|nr:hypothetical protein HPB48_008447 [Haemaphysalis longicornis]